MISNSGSGQMVPLPMNEFLQESMAQACGVKVEFDVVEWQVLLTASRSPPDSPALHGAVALNTSVALVGCGDPGAVFPGEFVVAGRVQLGALEG